MTLKKAALPAAFFEVHVFFQLVLTNAFRYPVK